MLPPYGFGAPTDSEPWYVADKDLKTDRLIVVQGSEHPALFRSEAELHDLHWTGGKAPKMPFRCEVQVRYRQEPVKATISKHGTRNFCSRSIVPSKPSRRDSPRYSTRGTGASAVGC